jgi:hypothetical protein
VGASNKNENSARGDGGAELAGMVLEDLLAALDSARILLSGEVTALEERKLTSIHGQLKSNKECALKTLRCTNHQIRLEVISIPCSDRGVLSSH